MSGAFCDLFGVTESWNPEKVLIGQESIYTLEFQIGEVNDPEIPAKGVHPDPKAPDLPWMEILSIKHEEQKIEVRVIYYESGIQTLPLDWKNSSGVLVRSSKSIVVESSLKDSDKTPEDIQPPLEFSGPYGWKLTAMIAGVLSLLLGGAYVYYLYKTKYRNPVDAIVQLDPLIERIQLYENRLENLLSAAPIRSREFYRALSGYIREAMSKKIGAPTSHLTEAELFDRLYNSFPVSQQDAERWEELLRVSQYASKESEIPKEAAEMALDYWKELLKR
ncbi:hypothetical protein CH373_07320 [Leptospira perolatii]|uniref:DUF4381 domain-containing protein n=1 Tax=Leptospira perolatii TaxID=2023191 RepID=A0A2M9ZQ59_9LEPT|nr:hypothetical protein CH360_04180 [Leptospira perolatii]PJZ74063.1 hypothetical protein CH373_07320 [Leptospira perolatii]